MEKTSFITYEQASNLGKIKETAEAYQEKMQGILMIFAKDTLLQFTNMDLYFDAMELWQVYRDKDYSRYLFTKTEEIFTKVDDIINDPKYMKTKEMMQQAAKAYTEAVNKLNKDLKDGK